MIGYIYVLLGLFIILRELFIYINHKSIDYLTIFDIYYFGYYIIPAAAHNLFPNYQSRYYYAIQYGEGTFAACVAIISAYFCILLAFKHVYVISFGKLEYNVRKRNYYIPNEKNFFWIVIIFLWCFGLLAFFIHCSFYGGVQNTLLNSAQIRNGDIETSSSSSILFISKFVSCLAYATYIVFIKYLKHETNIFVLCISIAFTFLYLIINAGRGAILNFVIIMTFIYSQISKKNIKIKTWILLFFIVVFGVSYLRPLLNNVTYIRYGLSRFYEEFLSTVRNSSSTNFTISNLLYRMCYYLEHKYVSLEVAIKVIRNSLYSYNFFVTDIFVGIIAFIPEMFLPFKKPESISTYNTQFVGSGAKNSIGTVPPGGIAFGYYAMGILGVIFFSFIFGVIGKKMCVFFDNFESDYLKALKFINVFVWIDFFINGDLRQCVVRNFIFLFLLLIIKIYRKPIYSHDKKLTE